jgi:tRNA threonylcarbamoyladenosine biosynthesis protein TsaE
MPENSAGWFTFTRLTAAYCGNFFISKIVMIRVTTHSPEETRDLAAGLVQRLGPGTVLALRGPLGSGKTCFAQGCGRGLGVEERYITSPSFVLVREYRGRLPFYHIDLYRLSAGPALALLGLEEYIDGEGVTVIEWAEKLAGALPPRTIEILFAGRGETQREISIIYPENNQYGQDPRH